MQGNLNGRVAGVASLGPAPKPAGEKSAEAKATSEKDQANGTD